MPSPKRPVAKPLNCVTCGSSHFLKSHTKCNSLTSTTWYLMFQQQADRLKKASDGVNCVLL
eukprot:543564-Pleurochrysis_carterae.AAC.1